MKKIAFDPSNPAEVVTSVREFLEETRSVYQGLIDQVPEQFKTQVAALKTKVDAALTSLASKPTEQVPAALDASYALRHLSHMVESFQEMITGTMEAMNKLVADYTPKATALQSLQGRIDKKELVEATEADKRVTDATEATRKAERDRAKLLNSRRTILAKADVPLPLEDETLDGDDKAFEAVKTKTTERVKKLRDLGHLSAMNAEDLTKLIYGPEEMFNFAVKLAENAGKSGAADPMLGGRTENGKPNKRFAIA